jgi:thiamine-monophosphate kinase
MSVNDEFALIRQWTNLYQSAALQKSLGVVVGIGDDAAVVQLKSGYELVLSCDTMVQDIHFNEQTMRMADVGFKAMSAALSDLAAMGAIPRYALISLTVPRNVDVLASQEIYEGLYACAGKFGVAIVGGDTTSTRGCSVITIQVIGEIEAGKALLRSAARPGDILFITGLLGGSAAGLDYLSSETPISLDSDQIKLVERLIEKHRRPLPQIRAGRTLLLSGACHALNDISDGLASEAWEIAEASDLGIILHEDQIPMDPDLTTYAGWTGNTALDWILYGGEDYQLVGTISPLQIELVKQEFSRRNLSFYTIGEVVDTLRGVHLQTLEGAAVEVPKNGYNHFAAEE